jgi:hypothetical protein
MIKASRWIRVVAVSALLSAGCGGVGGPATGNVASAVRTTSSASPTPQAASPSPTQTSTPRLALVTLRGSDAYVIRDVTDISHPRTIGNLGTIAGMTATPQFVNATEVSYSNQTGLFRMPLSGSPKTLVVKDGGGGEWSPDGKAVVYTTSSPANSCSGTTTVHQFRSGLDQVLGSIPNTGCGGCEPPAGCDWLDSRLSFSPDGTLISLVVDAFSGSFFRIWSSSGTLLKSSDGGATMSAWSGQGLYFQGAKGVEVWRNGVVSSFLPGVTWIRSKGSPSGGQIVYTTRGGGGWSHIFVVDTATRKVRELKSDRTDAVFLTSRYVWYEGERACVANDLCGPTPAGHPLSGKTYIYDLQDGTETESIITSVSDVWPHAA